MKWILFSAATLMAGASVWGVIDYRSQRGKSEFENLYTRGTGESAVPEKKREPVERIERTPVTTASVNTTVKTEVKKSKKVKSRRPKKISVKSFSRASFERDEKVINVKDLKKEL